MRPSQPLPADNSCLSLLMLGRAWVGQLWGAVLEAARQLPSKLSCLRQLSRSSGTHQAHLLCEAGKSSAAVPPFQTVCLDVQIQRQGHPDSSRRGLHRRPPPCTHTSQVLLVITFATRRYLQRRYGARLASLAPSSTQAQQVWGAWHAAGRQHQNLDSAGGSRAPPPPPAESSAWQAFLLDLEPTDPEWDSRQQGHLLLQGLLTSRYPAPGSFCLLPVAACCEEGPAAAGGAASGIQAAEAPSSRAEGGPAVAPEHASLPLLSEVVISSSSSAGPQARLQRPPDLSGQGAAAGKPSAHAKWLSTAARLLPDVAAVLGQLLMAEAGALAGRSTALRLLAKHVENRAAALVHQAEDLALEVQRRRPVSMQQGVHALPGAVPTAH